MRAGLRAGAGAVTVWLALLASALALVYAEHAGRGLFVELQSLSTERDRLDIEWGRLRIEQGTWATHARVEGLARGELSMLVPAAEEILLVKP